HGVLDHQPRIQLDDGRTDGGHHDFRIDHRRDRRLPLQFNGFHGRSSESEIDQNTVLALPARCSTMGPSASAGKKVRPPMIRITPTTRPTNRPPVVGNVPIEAGIDFFSASEPAIAIAGTIMKKRPTNIALASVRL